jgi:hypothetical protein
MTTPTKKKMSLLRRHRLLEDDVRRVMAHLTAHKRISTSDVLSRPRLKKKKDSGPTEEIPWAHAPLSGSWQQPSLKPGPNNSKVLYTKENGEWKLVVPEEQVEKFLRKAMLDPKSGMPLGRDSAYHHMQKTTIGVSRRRLYAFLEKQGVLQISRNIPNEQGKGGEEIEKRGICEMDLIEGKGRDLHKYYGPRGDWYWLSLIDRLTGYGLVATTTLKTSKKVAEKLRELLNMMEYKLGAKVTRIDADHGREFFSHVVTLLKRRKIQLKLVSRGSKVEKFNQDYQRNFYRLLRMRRGNFGALEDQALQLTNNTKGKWTKKTPEEALKTPDSVLALGYRKGREKSKAYRGKNPKVGDKARHLVKLRKNIHPILTIKGQARLYKSYHGRHFTKQVYTIKEIRNNPKPVPPGTPKPRNPKPPTYFLHGRWFNRDQLLLISGTDAETEKQIDARPKKGVPT